MVLHASAVLMVEGTWWLGLDTAVAAAPAPWRKPRREHDLGKILPDPALATSLSESGLAHAAMLRA